MVKDDRIVPKTESPGYNPEKWTRFDAVARWLMLIAFAAFAVVTGMNLRLIQQQLEHLETRIAEEKQATVEQDYWKLTREGTTPEIRTESFLRLVRAGNSEWRLTRLNELNLDKAALNGTQLQYALFKACSLKQAEMRNTDLSGGGFELSDLIETNLENARIISGQIFRCSLKRVNLKNGKLRGTNFEQTRLFNVEMFNAEMAEAKLKLAVFKDCDLQSVDLTSADLTNTKIIRTHLRNARLPDALLVNTDFTDSNWWRARGLPPRMIEEYRKRFPPSKNAPKEFRQDWELWQKTGG